jgi:hypothetical protein
MSVSLVLNIVGAIIGSSAACLYAFRIWQKKEKANLATWFIIFLLDFIGLYLAYATGNTEPYIQIGWCVAATLILIATWIRKGEWIWMKTETLVLLTCVASILVWVTSKAVIISLLGYIIAAILSAWPQAKDYMKNQKVARASAWIWQVSAIAILFSLGAKFLNNEYGVEHTLVYYALLGLNVAMATLCTRKT